MYKSYTGSSSFGQKKTNSNFKRSPGSSWSPSSSKPRFGEKPSRPSGSSYSHSRPTGSSTYNSRPAASSYSSSRPSTSSFSKPRSGGYSSRPGSRPGSNFPRNNGRKKFGEHIDVSKFVQKSSGVAERAEEKIINSFADFGFCDAINANLKKRNFVAPTQIQDLTISQGMAGRDIIGLADTGTGKTAAFLLPLIEKVYKDRSQKVLIVAPTRELATQIENEFRQFSWDMKIFSALCVGGAPIFKQIGNLRRDPNFVIGTPGRLADLSNRCQIDYTTFNNIVLDEVDRMLDMGFIDEITTILKALPETKQSFFFSATMSTKIKHIVEAFAVNPISVSTKTGHGSSNVDADVVRVHNYADKFNQLTELLKKEEVEKTLIFIETKREVEKMATELSREGFKVDSLHGDKKQSQRTRALNQFRDSTIDILVATDVAARGLDVKNISHVINYTVPQTYDDFIHRIGRTGRGTSRGYAYTFVE